MADFQGKAASLPELFGAAFDCGVLWVSIAGKGQSASAKGLEAVAKATKASTATLSQVAQSAKVASRIGNEIAEAVFKRYVPGQMSAEVAHDELCRKMAKQGIAFRNALEAPPAAGKEGGHTPSELPHKAAVEAIAGLLAPWCPADSLLPAKVLVDKFAVRYRMSEGW